jgi:hypothetical protein
LPQESSRKLPEMAFPEPYLFTETENKMIDDIAQGFNGLGSNPVPNSPQRYQPSR